jgi:hypothetical protein
MKWLTWHWRLWRARHWEWLALVKYQQAPYRIRYERWQRAKIRADQIYMDPPRRRGRAG